MDASSDVVACGITTEGLDVLEEDWEAACFVEKCAGCFAAVLAEQVGRHNR